MITDPGLPMSTPPEPPDPDRTGVRPEGLAPNLAGQAYPFLSPTDRPGELGRLGRYRVVNLLGAGAMGFVFRAEDEGLRRPVALKVMKADVGADSIARERFLREGQAAAAIRSDHVITIYDVGEANGTVYLAMELLAGENLDDWLKARPSPVPEKALVRIAKDVLKGLAAAHDKGLIHRDIKPANLWVDTESNRVKLLDFGLTRRDGADRELTHTGQVVGTPAYLSPEQAGSKPVDARADLFSLGVVLHRMLTGTSPFVREGILPTLFAVAFEPIPPVASLGAGICGEMAGLIDRLLAKKPEDRPASAKAALAVVAEVERQIRAGRPTASGEVPVVPVTPAAAVPPAGAVLRGGPTARVNDRVPPTERLLPGEFLETFEYMIEGQRRNGTRRVLKLEIADGVAMEFVRIPKGSFLMGAPEGEKEALESEKPQHRVEITRHFYLGKYAVTQAEYRAVTGKSPSHFKGDRLPVESVSWDEAVKFCERVSSRTQRKVELPSEAMWEYACRAGTITPYHFGSTLNGDLANCNGKNPYGTDVKGTYKNTTVAVGSYPANPWGLCDMHGNVWEWCQDWFGPYDKVEGTSDPIQLLKQSEDRRVLRGGSWDDLAWNCRAANRVYSSPDYRYNDSGFRVCFRLDLL